MDERRPWRHRHWNTSDRTGGPETPEAPENVPDSDDIPISQGTSGFVKNKANQAIIYSN